MPVELVSLSHTPLLGKVPVRAEITAELDAVFGTLRSTVAEFSPDITVLFAPDHYNGFFHDLMPPFCVGMAAESIGDFDSQAGDLPVPAGFAEELTQSVLDQGVDVAFSRAMQVDHGAVQPLEVLFGGLDTGPVVPVFVNGVAAPFTPMERVRRLGEAVGRFLAARPERVLLLASGGLSHDPPVPQWDTTPPESRTALLNNRNPTAEARARRETRVINTAHEFAAGSAAIQDLNPEWDRKFLSLCARGDLDALATYDHAEMAREAGHSSHEVRTWVAAASAMAAAGGPFRATTEYYRAIREYIAGFAALAASPQDDTRPVEVPQQEAIR